MVSFKALALTSLASVYAQNSSVVSSNSTVAATNTTQSAVSQCPSGYVQGFNSVSISIEATPEDVWNLIGDFGDLSWAGVDETNLTAGTGDDNVPGVQRTSVQLGLFINETLISYKDFDSATQTAQEIHSVAPFSVAPIINTTVSATSDGITISPLCNGAATKIIFAVYYCAQANLTTQVSALFGQAHLAQLNSAQQILGAANSTSCAASSGTAVGSAGSTASVTANAGAASTGAATSLPAASAGVKSNLSMVSSSLALLIAALYAMCL